MKYSLECGSYTGLAPGGIESLPSGQVTLQLALQILMKHRATAEESLSAMQLSIFAIQIFAKAVQFESHSLAVSDLT